MGFYWVSLGFTGFYTVLLGFTRFYWVLLGFTGFYWVLLCLTKDDRYNGDLTEFSWVFTRMIESYIKKKADVESFSSNFCR